jgi:hypothetical protein
MTTVSKPKMKPASAAESDQKKRRADMGRAGFYTPDRPRAQWR